MSLRPLTAVYIQPTTATKRPSETPSEKAADNTTPIQWTTRGIINNAWHSRTSQPWREKNKESHPGEIAINYSGPQLLQLFQAEFIVPHYKLVFFN